MGYKNVKGSQVDLTELAEPLEVMITDKTEVIIEDRPTPKFHGYDPEGNSIEFLGSAQLEEVLAPGKVFMIEFKGVKELKGGKKLNLFKVDEWEGDPPPWAVSQKPAKKKK